MNMHLDNKILVSSFLFISLNILVILSSNYAIAAENFNIIANIDLTTIPNPEKLKVVAFANGESAVKYIENLADVKSNSISIPFTFEKTNDFVTVGGNDEFFVCAYDLNAQTDDMKSYSCVEGNIEQPDGKNIVNIGSGPKKTLSTGSFQTVEFGGKPDTKNVKINILVPLSDRKNVENIKVVAMDKGELKSKSVNAAELLKNSTGDTIKFTFSFERESDIGQIQQGDMYFACVSANELNPPEGTECEHKLTKIIGRDNNLYAR
jgi:hypothetical protein